MTGKRQRKQRVWFALCVMAESLGGDIDLKEESLIGVIVIGKGFPWFVRAEILKTILRKQKPGFAYAFQYPG